MRIWTIQSWQVWELLQKKRMIYVQEDHKEYEGYIPVAYRWLKKQLKRRLPNYSGHLPWWAHCKKPDLRCHRHALQKGETEVRLELEIADELILLFPCWAWDTIFRQDYLAATRKEYEDWNKKLRGAVPDEDTWPLPQPWRSQLKASWQRLFDIDLPVQNWGKGWLFPRSKSMEGVFEALRLEDVQKVTIFKGVGNFRRPT